MLSSVTQIAIGLGLLGVVLWLDDGSVFESYEEPPPRDGWEGPESPWVRNEVQDDRDVRSHFSQRGWFTVTDVARALQSRGFRGKPSGSANRDANNLIGRWISEGKLEKRNARSGRPLYRLKSISV